MTTVRVQYEIDDGYAGKARPQYFEIDTEDFKDMTEDQIEQAIVNAAEDHMRQNMSVVVENMSEAIAAIQGALAETEG